MALLDMSFTKGFFSEIANSDDICYYCEKAIREERNKGKLRHDDFIKKIKSITGVLEGKRVAKLNYVGHQFCICPNCLESIVKEVIKESNTPKEKILDEEAVKTKTTKSKVKAK